MIFPVQNVFMFGKIIPVELSKYPATTYVSQDFYGTAIDYQTIEGKKTHGGWDIPVQIGEPCYAPIKGKVVYAKRQYNGADDIGNLVIINHYEDGLQTWYRHAQDIVISVGDEVSEGQLIQHCDTTGKYCYGTHLHYEIKKIDAQGNVLNLDNGWKGDVDPVQFYNSMVVDQEILNNLYLAVFGRMPDPASQGYLGQDINFVLNQLMQSKEYQADASVLQAVHGKFSVIV